MRRAQEDVMSKYRIEGTIVDTSKATASWSEDTRFNGHNHISLVTGSQWEHQRLYRSRRGRFYVEHWSQWQGSTPHAEWISPEEAARWLLINNREVPPELWDEANQVSE